MWMYISQVMCNEKNNYNKWEQIKRWKEANSSSLSYLYERHWAIRLTKRDKGIECESISPSRDVDQEENNEAKRLWD